MAGPSYLICVECESPSYIFEWEEGQVTEATCEVCGNEDPEQFMTEEDFDSFTGG